jgi:uncharacterized protein YraI
MRHPAASAFLALAMASASWVAQAQGTVAFTSKDVNQRAGPARDYPVVAVLPPGFQVLVQGCLPNYTWCDVLAGASRGWIYAGNITYSYQGAPVPLLNYGAVIGIGVFGFVLNDYWHDYYRDRPWYPDRNRWINRPRLRPVPRPQPQPQYRPAPNVRPEHPRLPQNAAPIGPRPPRPQAVPGVTPRPPRQAQPPGPRPGRQDQRDGPGRGDRPQR